MYGYYDPFLFGPGYSDIDSYTVYTSGLTMKIDRVSDRKRLFEGTAQAQSLSNNHTYLVPNLIEAMFPNFPGQSGETVRVTIDPEKNNAKAPTLSRHRPAVSWHHRLIFCLKRS